MRNWYGRDNYQRRPPERGFVSVKGPNMMIVVSDLNAVVESREVLRCHVASDGM